MGVDFSHALKLTTFAWHEASEPLDPEQLDGVPGRFDAWTSPSKLSVGVPIAED